MRDTCLCNWSMWKSFIEKNYARIDKISNRQWFCLSLRHVFTCRHLSECFTTQKYSVRMNHVNAHNNHNFYMRLYQEVYTYQFAQWMLELRKNEWHAVKEIDVKLSFSNISTNHPLLVHTYSCIACLCKNRLIWYTLLIWTIFLVKICWNVLGDLSRTTATCVHELNIHWIQFEFISSFFGKSYESSMVNIKPMRISTDSE